VLRLGMLGLFALAFALTSTPRSAYAEQTGTVTAKGEATKSSEDEAVAWASINLSHAEDSINQTYESLGLWVDFDPAGTITVVKNADGSFTATQTAVGHIERIPR